MRILLVGIVILMTGALVIVDGQKNLEVVPAVDLARYAGKWYEIARLPNRFQNKCAGEVSAVYQRLEGGGLRVTNECHQSDGRMSRAEGKARPAGKGAPGAKLEVRFAPAWVSWLPAVWGDYWIIDLASDYSYSVVGTPDRKYLWILSREPRIDEAVYRGIIERTAAKGFDVSRLIKTRQSATAQVKS
jgi:apolipoprotein D and lipocalin family protein